MRTLPILPVNSWTMPVIIILTIFIMLASLLLIRLRNNQAKLQCVCVLFLMSAILVCAHTKSEKITIWMFVELAYIIIFKTFAMGFLVYDLINFPNNPTFWVLAFNFVFLFVHFYLLVSAMEILGIQGWTGTVDPIAVINDPAPLE